MRKINLLIVIFLLISIQLFSAQTDWSLNYFINNTRNYTNNFNNFFKALNEKDAKVGDKISLTFREITGADDDSIFIKVQISQIDQVINGVSYKYKLDLWVPSDSNYKGELFTNVGFTSGISIERQTNSSATIAYSYTEWDNNNTRKHLRQTYLRDANQRWVMDTYQYDQNIIVYGMEYLTSAALSPNGKLVVNLLGAIINKTTPYNTVVRYGFADYDATYQFEYDVRIGANTSFLIGKFNDNSSFSNGWDSDGYNVSYNFVGDGYPAPTQIDINIFSTYNTYAFLSGITINDTTKTIDFGNGNTHTLSMTSPDF